MVKRGGRLKRTKKLVSRSKLTRTEWKRTAAPRSIPKPREARRKPTPDPITPDVRRAIAERSRDVCEARLVGVCVGRARHIHHRKLRRYGDHTLVNLLHVCHACHGYIHRFPKWSYDHGYLVRGSADPARIMPGQSLA